ncbi:Jerky -like [Araneus ventricosus]|uniref:Jerky-like n=1 Tax=Araneus ventricosus TaxID=182803 RepID=A0A4Y2QYH7_ARAVE|nr:Jerky -like [Araneus ventricosus]
MEPTKQKHVLLIVEEKFQIVSRIEAGETLTKLLKEFGVGVSTVGDMRLDSEKIKKFYTATNGNRFIAELQDLIAKEKLTADQIYNCDVTGLYWRALLTKSLASEKETVAPSWKRVKDRATILGCANASGSHRVKMTLVDKSKKPRCFKNVNKTALPVHYMHQESAWMNCNLCLEWFHDCSVPEVKKNLNKLKLKKAILLMDNAPAHPDVETLKSESITCIFMAPNTTAILQPMDQGLIESMKRRYRKPFLSKLLFEGDDDDKEIVCSSVQFLKALTLKDCLYN